MRHDPPPRRLSALLESKAREGAAGQEQAATSEGFEMTCFHFQIGDSHGIVTMSDAVEGSYGKWHWEFDERFGPLWLRKDGEPRKCQCPGKAAWAAFEIWLAEYRKEHPAPPIEGEPLDIGGGDE